MATQTQKREQAPQSGNLVEWRTSVYEELRSLGSVKTAFPLLTIFSIPPKNLERLQKSVMNFIMASLRLSYDQSFDDRPDFLTAYAPQIIGLPNLTPNGACYPKRETVFEYNILHRDAVAACRESGVLQHLRLLTPLTLRIMRGKTTEDIDNRPFSTAKAHSDAWVGHAGDGIASLSVMGDVEGTRIEFFEPVDPEPNFFAELDNYNEGTTRYRSLKQYPLKRDLGDLYLFDHLALHQTFRAQGGLRVSLNFGFVVDSPASLSAATTPSRFDYWHRDAWAAIGSTSMQLVDESMADLSKKYGGPGGGDSQRRYAPIRTIPLWPSL